MEPISIIMTALLLGMAAGLKDTATQSVKEAYGALKKRLSEQHKIELSDLEADQSSESEQKVIAERLAKRNVYQDPETLRLSSALTQTVQNDLPSHQIYVKIISSEDVITRISKEASAKLDVQNSKRVSTDIS